MILTNDDDLYQRMTLLRSQGVDPNKRYWHVIRGYNFRMTNMQAAIGLGQLENIAWHIAERRRVANTYKRLFEEYNRFVSRSRTITTLSEISATTKEWEQLAETQQSFLPQKIPNIPKLKIATYYRPLVNVSGDYFSILPIDSSKTLLMLGDVSGKGLPAALIMGLVMNTVKIIEDKEDLVGVLHAIDKAIKGMHLQDKYTVLFLSIIFVLFYNITVK